MPLAVKVLIALLLGTASTFGQLVLYEAAWGTFPDDQGWERMTFCKPLRQLENGWLVQHVEFGNCVPGKGGEYDYYRYYLNYLTGSPTFFLEWVSFSDGPIDEIIYVAPSSIVASSVSGAVSNHFTIADESARYVRDVDDIPHVYAEIDPAVPHTYRLEYHNSGAGWYVWLIDGAIIDEGIPEGPFPSFNPSFPGVTAFQAKSVLTTSETRWKYIRVGRIPDAGSLDFTNDELVTLLDYYLFQDYLLQSGPATPHARGWDCGDADDDDDIDLADLADFQNLFMNGE